MQNEENRGKFVSGESLTVGSIKESLVSEADGKHERESNYDSERILSMV